MSMESFSPDGSLTLPPGVIAYDNLTSQRKSRETSFLSQEEQVGAPSKANRFRLQLERHLDDYERGHGNRSKDTSALIREKSSQNSLNLTYQDPKFSKQYSGYSTAFSYAQRSRFIAGVEEGIKTVQKATLTNFPYLDKNQSQKIVDPRGSLIDVIL